MFLCHMCGKVEGYERTDLNGKLRLCDECYKIAKLYVEAGEETMYSWNEKDNDWWDKGEFNSVEECIQEAVVGYGKKSGDIIEIGEICPFEPQVDIENMLERLEEYAYEECGEAAESWRIAYREEHQEEWDELFEGVQALVTEYLDKIGEKPKFYRIENIRTIKIFREE